jgi:redox-sensitive bicupin YhaK (pirin superfamily)
MIVKRPADTRGIMKKSWIESRRTFSNNDYITLRYPNFSDLEVINDDIVQPGGHVPLHQHKNMDIFGYVVQGPCYHTDNLGNRTTVQSGGVQRMSSGRGIWHTEGNNSDQPIRYLQLWIKPPVEGTQPLYNNYHYTREDKLNKFCCLNKRLGILQDARVYAGIFTEPYTQELNPTRRYYLYMVLGTATINGQEAVEGDGFAFTEETTLEINSTESEIILFDLR